MTRDLTASQISAFEASQVTIFQMYEAAYDSATVRVTTLPYGMDIQYNGFTWYGLGTLLKVGATAEQTDGSAPDLSLELSGVDPDSISIVLNEYPQGRSLKIYLAVMDSDHVIIDDPLLYWKGFINNQTIRDDADTAVITLSATNELAKLLIPKVKRYNNDSHQARWPGDKFFEFIEQTANKPFVWGSSVVRRGIVYNGIG